MNTQPALLGKEIGRYQVMEFLGAGTFGQVFRARDLFLGRDVALKVSRADIASDPKSFKRFVKEARIQGRLEHANIVPIYDVIRHKQRLFLVMRYVQGSDLWTKIQRRGGQPLKPIEVMGFMRQILEAMQFAHSKGVIHRDLKPSNIQVTPAGEALILDLGAARLLDLEESSPSLVMGTPRYISPEQVCRRYSDARSDIYCLGLIFYELITGRHPFEGAKDLIEMLQCQERTRPAKPHELVPELPPDFGLAIMKSLEKSPRTRYCSCREFADTLAESLGYEVNKPIGDEHVRWDPRVAVEMSIRIQIEGSNEVVRARSVDVSMGGVAVRMDSELPRGASVNVEFTLYEDLEPKTFRAEAVVVWTRRGVDGSTILCGLNFRQLGDDERSNLAILVRDALVLGQNRQDESQQLESSLQRYALLLETETLSLPG